MKLRNRIRFERNDYIALLVCLVLFVTSLISIRFRIILVDEKNCLAGLQHLLNGARPMVDESHLAQLFGLFLVPFFALFKAVTGGTAGVVLFMRQIYLLFSFTCYWALYRRLRPYRMWGIVISALVCSYVPWEIYTLNYYTLSIGFLLLVCVALFLGEKEIKKGRLLLAGVLLSCAVIAEPPFALMYFAYSIVVLVFEIRRRKQPSFGDRLAFFFNHRCWLYMTASIAVCAAVFLTVLGIWSGWKNILANIPLMLSDPDYSMLDFGIKSFFAEKFPELLRTCGVVNCTLAAAVLLATVSCAASKKMRKYKYIVFFVSNCLFLLMFSYHLMFREYDFLSVVQDGFNNSVYPVAFMLFGFVNYLLCKEKDRSLFLIWLISVLASFCMDLFSANSLGFCGILSAIPGILWFKTVLDEFVEEARTTQKDGKQNRKKEAKSKKDALSTGGSLRNRNLVAASLAVFVIFVVWKGFMVGFERYAQTRYDLRFNTNESSYASLVKLDKGPHKGMFTSKSNCVLYQHTLCDMDLIRQETDGAVLLEEYDPVAIIYLDRPLVNFSVHNPYEMINRQLFYFLQHPEKQPEVIALQTYDESTDLIYSEKRLEYVQQLADFLCDGIVVQGKQGLIVKVSNWHIHSEEEIKAWLAAHADGF